MSKIHTVKALVKFCKVNKAESKQSLSFCLDSDSANKLLIEYKKNFDTSYYVVNLCLYSFFSVI